MERYKLESLSKWWYVLLFGSFLWYMATGVPVAAALLFFVIIVFIGVLLLRRLKLFVAHVKIRSVAYKLENVHTLSELSEAICSFPKAKSSLKIYLLNMALEKMGEIRLTAMRVNHIIANGRPCYLIGHGLQVPRRKRGGEAYFDFSTAREITYFVFPNNFEWLLDDAHQAIPIGNIVDMEIYVDNDILAIMKRGHGMFCFYGKDIILLKAVIEALQAKRMQSW